MKLAAVVVASCCFSLINSVVAHSQTRLAEGPLSQTFRTKGPRNAQSCSECHAVPVLGGSSRVTVIRAGRRVSGHYVSGHRDGTLYYLQNELKIDGPEHSASLRVALNILGEGYIEAVPDQEFRSIAALQKR